MADVLWVDDDAPLFPEVRYRLERELNATVHECHVVREAIRWLKNQGEENVKCLILDVLMPFDDESATAGLEDEESRYAEYPGLLVLEKYGSLRDRTVVLSCVGDSDFPADLLSDVRRVKKLELGRDMVNELIRNVKEIMEGKAKC